MAPLHVSAPASERVGNFLLYVYWGWLSGALLLFTAVATQLLLCAAASSSSAPPSPAACTKVTKCTECQQARSSEQSVDFTLQSLYNRRSVSVHAHCALACSAPSSRATNQPARHLPLLARHSVFSLSLSLSKSVCACVYSPRYLRACSPLHPNRTQISNNGSTLHSAAADVNVHVNVNAICLHFYFFFSLCTFVLASPPVGGAFALVCFITHDRCFKADAHRALTHAHAHIYSHSYPHIRKCTSLSRKIANALPTLSRRLIAVAVAWTKVHCSIYVYKMHRIYR